MFGFSFGLVMLASVVFLPISYLVVYGATLFDAWRLGKEIPKHKVKVNIVLGIVIGIVFGGMAQYWWDSIDHCMKAGNNFGSCVLTLIRETGFSL